MLNADQQTVLKQFQDGLVTLSEMGDAFRTTGIEMQGLSKVDGKIQLNLVKETEQKCEQTGWPKLTYKTVELF